MAAYSKMQEEKNKQKKELLCKNKPEFKYQEYSHPIYAAKNEKDCSEKNINGEAKQQFDKEVSMGVDHRPNQPLQQKMK